MKKALKAKAALLAAGSLLAASASAGVAVDPLAPETSPTTIEASVVMDEAASANDVEKKAPATHKWAVALIAAGAFGALLKLIGARKAVKAVSEAAQVAARSAAVAASGAAKAAGRVFGGPVRLIAGFAGFGLFLLVGVGLYDVEWIAGLIIGAGAAIAGTSAIGKLRRAWFPRVRDNEN